MPDKEAKQDTSAKMNTELGTKEKHTEESEIAELKMRKSRKKAAFTRLCNRLENLCAEDDTTRTELKETLDKVECAMDESTESIQDLVEFYKVNKRTTEMTKTVQEISSIEEQYDNLMKSYRAQYSDVGSTSNVKTNKSTSNKDKTDKQNELGADLWKQLKRVSIPVFDGDKHKYQSWKAAFTACIDSAPATAEYKLLHFRQYLSGEALKAIEKLGHSEASYVAAKDRLERKYGGHRRQVAVYLEELDKFPPMREEIAKKIEQFADLLDVAVINFKEANREEELGNGSLYLNVQKKMPESMLTRYHRWIGESEKTESLETLRLWVIDEAKNYTVASETLHGLADKKVRRRQSDKTRTFYTDSKGSHQTAEKKCAICSGSHQNYACQLFNALDINDRWKKAKEKNLCFRCLKSSHRGTDCRNFRRCNIDGCKRTHNRLLHNRTETSQKRELRADAPEFKVDSVQQSFTSTVQKEIIALRTVAVFVTANSRTLKINALLDDGSSTTYINEDVANELGLEGQVNTVNVNMLNGRSDRFKTMTVDFSIDSEDHKLKTVITANTTKNVTGSLQAVDWNELSSKWHHLKSIKFPRVNDKRKVDMLIGIDYADLHRSLNEVRGKPGEPIARLTPMGWTCVGPTVPHMTDDTNSYFSFFGSDLDNTLKRFWEIENVTTEKPIMSQDDKVAYKRAQETIVEKNNMYEIGILWKKCRENLDNNYDMAVNRLKNTEKRLKKSPEVSEVYSRTIRDYLDKGYISKVCESEHDTSNSWYLPHSQLSDQTKPQQRFVQYLMLQPSTRV